MADPNDLTPREMQTLALAWQCMESEPKIDNKKLAALTGYTEGSAAVTLGKIKRKMKLKAAGSTGVVNTPKKPAATPRVGRTPKSRKRSATEDAADDTPTKKGKNASKRANNEEEDDEEFGSFMVKKEEVNDINGGADAFFREAIDYADQV